MAILLPANMKSVHAALAGLDVGSASSDVELFADRLVVFPEVDGAPVGELDEGALLSFVFGISFSGSFMII